MKKNTELSQESLEEISNRCKSATAGPWASYVEGRDHQSGSNFIMTSGEDIEITGATTADQDFIAHARQDVPRLLEEVERLRRTLKELER